MDRRIWNTLAIGWVLATSSSAGGATFLDLRLTPDGSANPPGDVLELDILFYPSDPELRVEVRAFRVVEHPPAADAAVAQRVSDPIPSTTAGTRDEQGRFRLEGTAAPPATGSVTTVRFVVPYAALSLPIGEHSIAYDVTVFRGDAIEFSAATAVTFMTLTEEPRTEMRVLRPVQSVTLTTENRTIIVADPTADAGFREQSAQVTTESVTTDTVADTVAVHIPHGYLRRQRNLSMAFAPGDDDPLQAQLDSLQDGGKPWSWRKSEPILFATNRAIVDPQARDLSRFGATVSERVTYGSCLVTFPLEKHHRQGRLELPRWWERCDPDRHFSVDAVNVLGIREVQAQLRAALRDRRQDVLLMVHGYNNSFEFAMLRLAQLKLDIHFSGPAMLFSWPSQGSAGGYLADEGSAAQSVAGLKTVLKMLAAQRSAGNPDRRIHLLAHSMGNRVLLNALAELAAEGLARDAPPFGQVILAAPDVDFVTMNRVHRQAARCAEHITLYYCEDDVALKASRELNRDSRIGQHGVFAEGLENVDAKYASTSLLGHDYFSASNRLLVDLELLINLRLSASGRTQTVRPRTDSVGNQEWFFPALAR